MGSDAVHGRDALLRKVDRLLADALERRGGALAVLGGPGTGRTTVLDEVGRRATDYLILTVAGVAPERTLPGAALHRLLHPVGVPVPTVPRGPDLAFCAAVHRMFVSLARNGPVLCRVDDTHWLDPASLAALAYVARRVSTERMVIVFAGDDTVDALAGIPAARLAPLDDDASLLLLADRMPAWPAPDLAADLVELACGNPLALVELAEGLTVDQLAGVVPIVTLPPHSRLRRGIGQRFTALSAAARRAALMAAVDDELDLDIVLRGAPGADALDAAVAAGLVVVHDDTVSSPNALVRAIVRAHAPLAERNTAHRTLARVLDPERDHLRRTYHRAVIDLPDRDRLAAELRAGAAGVRAAGNFTASASAFERAASLIRPPDERAGCLLAAARDSWLAGGTRRARTLLRRADPLAAAAGLGGELDLVRGAVALRAGAPAAACEHLRAASTALLGSDRVSALTALVLAGEASCVIGDWAGFADTAARAAALRHAEEPPVARLIFDHFAGMAATYDGEHANALAPLRNVVRLADSVDDVTALILASQAAYTLGDATRSFDLSMRAVNAARTRSFTVLVPWALIHAAMSALLLDRHSTAVSVAAEGLRMAQAAGLRNCVADHLTILAMLAALRGDREATRDRLDAAADWVASQGLVRPATLGSWALACLDLVDDRPSDALDRLRMMAADVGGRGHLAIRVMAAPHVVEAAVRSRQPESATHALAVFDRWIGASDCAPRRALSHRSHALLADRVSDADEHFREAIRLHRRGETALELAKTELLYAARLRRRRKPTEARELLQDAVKIFHEYRAEPWAKHATAEMRAAGAPVALAPPGDLNQLTAQQREISRLVADGATNREIAARLYLSTRTVEHHLRNIFIKLGVRSRVELAARLR